MWQILDDKYGRISKLIDAVMLDIEQLRVVPDGDDKKFVEFVDLIERCHRDLQRIGMEREISNCCTDREETPYKHQIVVVR